MAGLNSIILLSAKEKYTPKLPYIITSRHVELTGPPDRRLHGISFKIVDHPVLKRKVVCVDKVKPPSTSDLTRVSNSELCG